jgi:hypothetical protein
MRRNFTLEFILLLSFFSCSDDEKYLGKVPVNGMTNVYFKIYQEESFDNNVAITFEIADAKDRKIYGPHFLCGTSDFDREDTKEFYAGSYDSIIYLAFGDSNLVYEMYDLRTGKHAFQFSGDTQNMDRGIEERLLKFDPRLRPDWKE